MKIKKYWYLPAGLVAGGLGGFLYWRAFGCAGACPITSSPVFSTIWGAVIGVLLFYIIFSGSGKKNKPLVPGGNYPPGDKNGTNE